MQKSALKRPIEVYCDFDGTITDVDSFDYLLEALALPGWRELEERWERDEITARECMRLQTELFPGSWTEITDALKQVSIDPTFATFVQWCSSSGIKLSVVSAGLDRVIDHLLEREGIKVDHIWSHHMVEIGTRQFTLASPDASGDCPLGVCKCAYLEQAGQAITKVVVGDGKSDFCWAKMADVLFAKDKLIDHCRKEQLPFIAFDNFQSVQKALESMLVMMHA